MNPKDSGPFTDDEWAAFEEELLARAREIARLIQERIRRAAGEDTAEGKGLGPDDPTGEVPVFG